MGKSSQNKRKTSETFLFGKTIVNNKIARLFPQLPGLELGNSVYEYQS